MRRIRRPGAPGIAIVVGILVAIAVLLVLPVSVRHNAPLGVSRTIDSGRSIAVRGGYVTPNYDGFDRLDLDLRAYGDDAYYDFTVHIRPSEPDAPDIRTIALRVPREQIWHQKGAFADAYLTVEFPEIDDAAGNRYYVWVESGPRNRDDIWTLWRIKSYSTTPVWSVAKAWIETAPEPLGRWPGGVALVLLMAATVGVLAWLFIALLRTIPPRASGRSV